jgi:hypothetical protein
MLGLRVGVKECGIEQDQHSTFIHFEDPSDG